MPPNGWRPSGGSYLVFHPSYSRAQRQPLAVLGVALVHGLADGLVQSANRRKAFSILSLFSIQDMTSHILTMKTKKVFMAV